MRSLIFVFGVLFLASFFVSAEVMFGNPTNVVQYNEPSIDDIYSGSEIDLYWPGLGNDDDEDCSAVSDFHVGIIPGGCSPMVVTSDLLEEQDVPVMCQLYAIQINPLIDVYSIDSISFKGDYPEGVSGISYYPANAAIKSQTSLVGSPTSSNIGYVVIRLKQEKIEDNMEDWIAGTLTAMISYDAENVYGTGQSQYYLDDSGTEENLVENSFWNGMGYLRLKGIGNNEATIEILEDKEDVFRTVTLAAGETSDIIYFPGYYCRAGLKVKLNSFVTDEDSVLLNVDGDTLWVRSGSSFLNGKCRVVNLDARDDGTGIVRISCPSNTFSLRVGESKGELTDANVGDDFSRAYSFANETLADLLNRYRSEKKGNLDQTYGEQALYEQIKLAEKAGLQREQRTLAILFSEKYPNSDLINSVENSVDLLGVYDYSNASASVYVSNDYHFISARKFRNVDTENKTVDFSFDGRDYRDMKEGQKVTVSENGEILIRDIGSGAVTFEYREGGSWKDSRTIGQDSYGSLYGRDIYVSYVETTKVAYVSLVPSVNNKAAEANFTFKIGIEKRAIDLSPEKTREMIDNLDASIKRWEDINERLGNLIRGMKGACFATSAFLTVKNMMDGLSGEALARKKVMEKYREICSTEEPYISMTKTQCYNELSEEIDTSVDVMANALNGVNTNVDKVLDKYENDGALTSSSKYVEELRGQVDPGWEHKGLTRDDLTTSSQISSVLLVASLQGGDKVALAAAQKDMENTLKSVVEDKKKTEENKITSSSVQKEFGYDFKVQGSTTANAKEKVWSGQKLDSSLASKLGEKAGAPYQVWRLNGLLYMLILRESGDKFGVGNIYSMDSGGTYTRLYLVKDSDNFVYNELHSFVFSNTGDIKACSYPWDSSNAELSYYESGKAKGRPALVPFDLENGWYAKISSDQYTDAGDVKMFYICNVGSNSRVENEDSCQSFNINTAGSVDSIGGCSMTKNELDELYSTARKSINEAIRKYGQKSVTINNFPVKIGPPSTTSVAYECQDFMSPEDCKLMFNLCDPVVCPTSRCDMGGAMRVTNVVQSGILGSILLCLPNAKEGIVVPVCLTGIHAGIESFVSILESERECLQKSLETGENVGICDEITSIYLCEFFWNQFSVFFEKIIPSVLNFMFGGNQQVRGGGEYLLVDEAYASAEASVSYFRDFYAQNVFAAFNIRSVEQAGTEVCNAFVGTSFPTSADMIDDLLEPDSPTQFYAYFSSETFSEATIPSTAHYKVYYHIYAGEDSGTQYKVYLTDPPESSYYKSHPVVDVDSGYIAAGETVDEAKDFTAPEGYKQLCVEINGQEECGFTSVSSSLAVDYASSKYVEDQANATNIKTESECISGKASFWSLASLNIQAGIEEMVDPDISLNGIVRVCATENPGNSVGESSRWRDVGYCGDENLDCWLDVSSVKDALKTVAAVEGTTIQELESVSGLFGNESGVSSSEVIAKLTELDARITGNELTKEELKKYDAKIRSEEEVAVLNNEVLLNYKDSIVVPLILEELNKIIGVGPDGYIGVSNANKAWAYMLKVRVYQKAAESFLADSVDRVVNQGSSGGGSVDLSGASSSSVCPLVTKIEGVDNIKDPAERVLFACEKMDSSKAYVGKVGCFDSVKYVYDLIGVGMGACFSDEIGKTYKGGKVVVDSTGAWSVGSCTRFSNEKSKLDGIRAGDILGIVYDEKQAHNVIFIEWVKRDEGIAKIFDWGALDPNRYRVYGYSEIDLSDDGDHPVFVYWHPVLSGGGGSSSSSVSIPEKDEKKIYTSIRQDNEKEVYFKYEDNVWKISTTKDNPSYTPITKSLHVVLENGFNIIDLVGMDENEGASLINRKS